MEIDPKILLSAQEIAAGGTPSSDLSADELAEARYLAKTLFCADCG